MWKSQNRLASNCMCGASPNAVSKGKFTPTGLYGTIAGNAQNVSPTTSSLLTEIGASRFARGSQLQMIIPGMQKLSVKSPMKYFGGKTYAAPTLFNFLPPNVSEIVSPFLGGASFELFLTGKGFTVYGYDAFSPLIDFWVAVQSNPKVLDNMIRDTIRRFGKDRNALYDFISEQCDEPMDNAHRFIMKVMFSFNGRFRKSTCVPYRIDSKGDAVRAFDRGCKDTIVNHKRIVNFFNPKLSVKHADFRESLKKHATLFCYADPPYVNSTVAYGDSPEYHEEFPHEELADILHRRETGWMLSYNNCDTVRNLYPPDDFRYDYPKWSIMTRSEKKNGASRYNEVVIRPKGQLTCS